MAALEKMLSLPHKLAVAQMVAEEEAYYASGEYLDGEPL